MAAEPTTAELTLALANACDVAIWLSGLPCLNPESEAWAAWESSARPRLFGALDVLKAAEAVLA
jgi:hypothetical protein